MPPTTEAYVVDAVRTPVGTRRGALADVHPADPGAHALRALVELTGIDPGAVEDVLMGCTGGAAGLRTMCEGGGRSNATIIERV